LSDEAIPPDARTLIASSIDSVVQLELLLLLQDSPQRQWSAADVARELRIDPAWAQDQLAQLCSRGLLSCEEETQSDQHYRFQPRSAELERAVVGLAQAYADRRVSVISLIYSKPADALRSFSDAFKFRKDDQDG
jgi:predicted ArsR family transcriptional regulator